METITLILSILAISLAIYQYLLKYHNVFKKNGVPHISPLIIFGNVLKVLLLRQNVSELLQYLYDSHPEAKYIGWHELMSPRLLIRDINLVKSVCVTNFEYFHDHYPIMDKNQDPLFGRMLMFLEGEKWRNVRNAVTPSLTASKLKGMFASMSNYAMVFADYVSKLPENEREIETKALLSKYTNDVIADYVYGVKVDSIKDPKNLFYVYGLKHIRLDGLWRSAKAVAWRDISWLAKIVGFQMLNDKISRFFIDSISSVVRSRDEQGIRKSDILQTLMDGRYKKVPGLTDHDVNVQALNFHFAGSDTVSSQLSFFLNRLAVNLDVQQKLREEIDRVLEETQGNVTYDVIKSMKYMDAFLNEGMRLNPIVFFLQRKCVKRFELPPALPGGKPFIVEPGMVLFIAMHSIQRDPKYYENPDKFDPERFLVNGKNIIHSGAYFPFGTGPRMCIAPRFSYLQMKLALFHLLARCIFKCCPKTDVPPKENKSTIAITVNGFWLRVEPRMDPHPLIRASATNGTCEAGS